MTNRRLKAPGDELNASVEKGKKCRWGRLILGVLLVLALACAAAIGLLRARYLAPILVEKATPDKAVGWLLCRDLSEEAPEIQKKLFDMYVGKITVPYKNKDGAVDYELPENLKKYAEIALANRKKRIDDWRKTYVRPGFLRVDYIIVPQKKRTSEYVLSSDVAPGPDLEKRWSARREKNPRKTTRVEKNTQTLLMLWFLDKMNRYDSAPDEQKKNVLDEISDEFERFQAFYKRITEKDGYDGDSRVDTLREFEANIDGWIECSTLDNLAKALWFKDLLVEIAVLRIAEFTADNPEGMLAYPPKIQNIASEQNGTANGEKIRTAFKKFFKKATDTIRERLFTSDADDAR